MILIFLCKITLPSLYVKWSHENYLPHEKQIKPALCVHVSWLHYFLGYEIFFMTCSSDIDLANQQMLFSITSVKNRRQCGQSVGIHRQPATVLNPVKWSCWKLTSHILMWVAEFLATSAKVVATNFDFHNNKKGNKENSPHGNMQGKTKI